VKLNSKNEYRVADSAAGFLKVADSAKIGDENFVERQISAESAVGGIKFRRNCGILLSQLQKMRNFLQNVRFRTFLLQILRLNF
jgi:hypothetical protein